MKYVVILGDGMADEPIESLNHQTILEDADTPFMDELAKHSQLGLAHTIPKGMQPGSDTANLAVLGYDPKLYYTGRSPLEALSIGVPMEDTDIAVRTNLVTLSEEPVPYEEQTILDHSSDEISTEDAAVLLDALREEFSKDLVWRERFCYYLGTSYRHCMIWRQGTVIPLTPPHDILTQPIGAYLPEMEDLILMMKRSYEILNQHPLNIERAKKGLHKANSLWFWGAGTKPRLDSFEEKNGKRGVMISAVDLLKGIAVAADMKVIEVPGANGSLHTNYEGKARAAAKALLEGYDFAYVHLEAPDEMGHQGSIAKKKQAVEYLDQRVVRLVKEELDQAGVPYRMLVTPDHPTPIRLRTHTADPVPFMIYDSTKQRNQAWNYNEKDAKASGFEIADGFRLMEEFLKP